MSSSDEALVLLSRALRPAGALLSESHPLLGELADAQARAHAARGQHIPLTLEPFTSRALHLQMLRNIICKYILCILSTSIGQLSYSVSCWYNYCSVNIQHVGSHIL